MITTFNYPTPQVTEGYLLDPEDQRVKSFPVAETVPFGRVIATVALDGSIGQLPSPNKFVFSADLITANVINGTVSVITSDDFGNQTTTPANIAPVTFATSNATTMLAIKAAIEALSVTLGTVLTATIDTTDATGRTIYVVSSDNYVVLLSNFVTTLGASQATASYNFFGKLRGVSIIANRQPDSNGVRQYRAKDNAGVSAQGRVIVLPIDATDINSSVFVQFIDQVGVAMRGTIRTSASSGNAIAFSRCTLNNKAGALSANVIELNLP